MSVLLIFTVITCLSLMVTPSIEKGLDQEMSMPKNSHVVKYFRYMVDLLAMGAPVYWVLKPGLNYSEPLQQNLICGGVECNNNSLSVQLYTQAQYPEITSLARPASSWLDDYIDWLAISDCCKYNVTTGGFCSSSEYSSNPFVFSTSIILQWYYRKNVIRSQSKRYKKHVTIIIVISRLQK